jgi:hypothetical protein
MVNLFETILTSNDVDSDFETDTDMIFNEDYYWYDSATEYLENE